MRLSKITGFFLVILMCLSLSACNKGKDNNNDNREDNGIAETASPTIIESREILNERNTSSKEAEVTEAVQNWNEVDYSNCFNGLEGCAIFFNKNTNVYTIYNHELCEKRVSPCSTFKIIATIMGLDKGIITSEDSTMGYDGTFYPTDKWNKDLSLKDAFKESCVWYFRKVIDQVGQSNVQSYLDQLKYGNCDISEWEGSGINSLPELNGFWLESSLKISPKEQVDVLANIFDGKTNFSKHNKDILKEVMLTKIIGRASVYGKTGTGQNSKTGHRNNGWFVGMMDNSDERYYFAIYLNDEAKEVSGPIAKEIAFKIMKQYYMK